MRHILPALLNATPKMMHVSWSRAQGAMVQRPTPSVIAADTKAGFSNSDLADKPNGLQGVGQLPGPTLACSLP
jgi:hypothetical protein